MTYTREADAHFAQHPQCPRCGATKTAQAVFGMPASEEEYHNAPDWQDWRGCCVTPDIWTCTACKHTWGDY